MKHVPSSLFITPGIDVAVPAVVGVAGAGTGVVAAGCG